MASSCCSPPAAETPAPDPGFRRVLWIALAINAGFFGIELAAALAAGSTSLQADAIDFAGDAGNYLISLLVVGMGLRARARAALVKGATMALFGLWVLAMAGWQVAAGGQPHAPTMGVVGAAALAANLVVFLLLWRHRAGDSNRRSVWLCSRNDLFGNLAVLLAALGVFGTGSFWPDALVAALMAGLALQGSVSVIRQALGELRETRRPAAREEAGPAYSASR